MSRSTLIALVTILSIVTISMKTASLEAGDDLKTKIERHRKEVEKNQAEFKRKFDQQRKEFDRKFKSSSSKSSSSSFSRTRTTTKPKVAEKPKLTEAQLAAKIARAPTPEQCLTAFLISVKRAKSFSELIKFLPSHERQRYERNLADYDPVRAKQRHAELIKEGNFDRELIDRMTAHPYDKGMKWFDDVAKHFHGVESVKIEGDRANLQVFTHEVGFNLTFGGRPTASVGMIFEDGIWRYNTYQRSLSISR